MVMFQKRQAKKICIFFSCGCKFLVLNNHGEYIFFFLYKENLN